ncbi:MAG TPA: tetratricopeptide repeat protein [Thermoanaerobaculia bacterium]|nr:tetratricopeptide repeat protein [Thermoanaerobaculia bacterium]
MSDSLSLGRRACAPARILLILIPLLALAAAASAQLPGTLNGQVEDENGTPIAGVLITVTDPETPDFQQTATTDDRGRFRIRLINATIPYDYRFTKEGYQEFTNPGLNIPARQNTRMNFTMKSVAAALAEAGAEIDAEQVARGAAIEVYNQGVAALQAGNQSTAESLFRSALEKDPELGPAHAALARLYLQGQRHQEAVDAAQRAIELETDPDAMNQVLYNAYTALGQQEQAAAALEKLKAANPERASQNLFNQAADAYNQGDMAAAKTGLEQVIAVDPEHAKAHYLLGLIYINEGENEKAKSHLEKFLELAPSDPDAATAQEMLKYLQQ